MLGSSPRGCCSSRCSHGISHSTYFGHILGASPIGLPPLRVPQCAGASLLTLQTRLGLISPSLAAQRGKPVVQGARNPPEQGQQTQTWSAPGRAQPLIWVQQQEAEPRQLPPGSPGAPRAGGPAAPPHLLHGWATTCSSAQHIHPRGNLSSLKLVAEPVGFIPC